jgi:hypothetical protein
MEIKLKNLLREIATLSDEDVKTLFLEIHKFPAINSSLLAKMQDLLANTFEDARTTVSDSLQPPRRSVRLSTKPLVSTHIEENESSKEDGVSSEHKIDKDIDYSVESSSSEEEEEEGENHHQKPIATQGKPVSNHIRYLNMSL